MSKHTEPTKADLVRFARAVIQVLRNAEDWGGDQLQEIADCAEANGISLSKPNTDEY